MTRRRRPRAWGVLLIIILVGAGATFVGLGVHQRSLGEPVAGGVRTTGTITGFQTNGGRDTTYTPHVRFLTSAGAEVDISAAVQDGRPTVGATVEVSYRPANPRDAHVLGSGRNWPVYVVLGSVFLAALPLAYVRAGLRRRRVRSRP